MKSTKFVFLSLIFSLLLESCNLAVGAPAAPQVVAASPTAVPSSTNTPKPSVTPYPSPTRRPTSTELPTVTPVLTVIYTPAETPFIVAAETANAAFAADTPVPFVVSQPGAAVPKPYQCTVREADPDFGEDFKPRTDFVTSWKVYNVGSAVWKEDNVVFDFVTGDKLHNPEREPAYLGYTVGGGDKIRLQVHMKSPKLPGRYSTTWGLRRVNKDEFFCVFSITIDVVK